MGKVIQFLSSCCASELTQTEDGILQLLKTDMGQRKTSYCMRHFSHFFFFFLCPLSVIDCW